MEMRVLTKNMFTVKENFWKKFEIVFKMKQANTAHN